ncbi:hypothetical protein Hanom_Chr12g01138651 [Helianthus anomalus]
MCPCYDCYVTGIMSSSKSGLSDVNDPMAINDPDRLSDDEDDFQPFALPDFGHDLPLVDGIPNEDPFLIPVPVQNHLIIGHLDGEHIVALVLDPVPLVVIL